MSELSWWVQQGDSAEVLKTLPDNSVDALVTDPPAGIGFMGREWDGHKGGRDKWIAWLAGILAECRRVMKPGAMGWVWALPRTAHWTATACEDAGFAVRDVLMHVFGTGFPKSRSLLKPAAEHWILIKAPGDLQELRIEENRIGVSKRVPGSPPKAANLTYGARPASAAEESTAGYDAATGRWPANFALSHEDMCVQVGTRKVKTSDPRRADGSVNCGLGTTGIYGGVADPDAKMNKPRYCDADGTETVEAWQCVEGCPVRMLDEQSGESKSGIERLPRGTGGMWTGKTNTPCGPQYGDKGGASRFFYVAKPSTKERSAGLPEGARNVHTTVKSVALMRHLVSLIAAPGQLVLDPFTGSGTTGIAALKQGCRFVGIEQSEEYCEIARRRIMHHAGTIPAHELADAAGVPGHDAPAHHADHGLLEHEQPAAGIPAQRAEGEPAAAGPGGAVDAREQHVTGREAPGTDH